MFSDAGWAVTPLQKHSTANEEIMPVRIRQDFKPISMVSGK
jgi:hypothetical protein